MSSVKPQGYHEHHRQKRRSGDERPVNKLYVPPELHDWIEKHPQEAMELGWTVSQYEDPAEVVVVIPDKIIVEPEKKPRKKPEPAKKKAVYSIRVPKIDPESKETFQEDGAALLEERVERLRELLCPVFGWDDDVPAYFPIIVGLDKGIEAIVLEACSELGLRVDP